MICRFFTKKLDACFLDTHQYSIYKLCTGKIVTLLYSISSTTSPHPPRIGIFSYYPPPQTRKVCALGPLFTSMRNAPFSKKKRVHPSVPKLNRLPVPTHSPPFNTHRRKKIPYDSQKFRSSNLSSKFPPYIITFLKIGKLKSNFHPHTHWRKHNTIHTETPTTPHPHTHTHKKKGAAFPPVHKWKTKDFYMDWDSITKVAPLPAKIKRGY